MFDAATGSVRATASGSLRPTSIEVDDATVYVGAGPTLHAFDRETWSKRWSHTVRRGEQWREADEDDPSAFGKGGKASGAGAGSRGVSVADGVVFEVDDAVTELAADGSVRWRRTFPTERLLGAHRNSLVFRRPDGLVARRR